MPSPARPAARRLLALALLPLAACDGTDLPSYGPGGTRPSAQLDVRLLAAGDTAYLLDPFTARTDVRVAPAGGTLAVDAQVWPGEIDGRLRRVGDGRLLVNGAALDGRIPRAVRGQIRYGGELAPAGDGVVAVVLPTIEDLPAAALRFQAVAQPAGTRPTLTADELRLPLVPPTTPDGVRAFGGYWRLTLSRGGATRVVEGSTPLGAQLVAPVGTLLPGDGPVDAHLSHTRSFGTDAATAPAGDAYQLGVTVVTTLRWTAITRGGAP
ncbi:hypothetical protein [Roseisolibacter sp. H3M3-2]|uniref:hypothetical protein n=1 Tax=Roseisolibacter sp. H3M3-2 TaxID=3031323 RepID=UPI0023DA6478|nr:hypothetical protein [Roseisolibacter sp. H3M3-2]MDF1504809.1 hypothetical protein [Roseisolibacter sp. H3M3-2]